MERRADVKEAKRLFGSNFIGFQELSSIADELKIQLPIFVPQIQYSSEEMQLHCKDCILILGVNNMADGRGLSLLTLRELFGTDSAVIEPSFYNQDWYMKEDFMQRNLENRWYLIKKDVFEDSRAILPNVLEKQYSFPSAVLCGYTFFAFWFCTKNILWKFDFVWCSDLDHNGDRIYIGKYVDIDGINKNGFSIHRHLELRKSYATINVY
jgi:hypothetical protein